MSKRATVLCMLPPASVARLSELLPEFTVIPVPMEGEVGPEVQGEILLFGGVSPTTPTVLDRGVKWAHTIASGIDSIPISLFANQIFTCSRGAGGIAISEWAMTMLLAYEKQLPQSWIHDDNATWTKANLGTLYDKTLALIGIGGIGTEIARRALPFGMNVVALRRRPIPAELPEVRIVTSLDELLPLADHLVIAAPVTSATRHLLDAHAFSIIKPGVHIVNISRGTLIDQDALRVALDNGRVAGASLDVQDPEPLPAGHWMYEHPKVKVSPHISWSAPWGQDRIFDKFRTNLELYLKGEPLQGVVDPAEGY